MERCKKWYIKIPHFYCFEYYEGDKKMTVEMDFRDPVYYLNTQMIEHWEKPYDEVEITMEEKKRILQNVREFLIHGGMDIDRIVLEDI